MRSKLEPHQIERLKDRVVLSDLVGAKVAWDKKKTNVRKQDYWACCPFHGEARPSFHVDNSRKRYHCFGCGASGDAISWLVEFEGLSFIDAVKHLAGGDVSDLQGSSKQDTEAYQKRRALADRQEQDRTENIRASAKRIWDSGIPITGTLADTYLRNRGVDVDIGFPSLRYVEDLPHPESSLKYPVLVAAVQGPDMKFRGIWRIYLSWHGEKAAVSNAKLGLGPCSGGAVWLGKPETKINACEGIETGFGVLGLLSGKGTVACTLSTSGMMNFDPPPIVESTLIWPDGDSDKIRQTSRGERTIPSPGLEAARGLHDKLTEAGRTVSIQPTPTTGRDYLDVWNFLRGR